MRRSVVICGSITDLRLSQICLDSLRNWHQGEIILCTDEQSFSQVRVLQGFTKLVLSEPVPNDFLNFLRLYRTGLEVAEAEQVLMTRPFLAHFRNIFDHMGQHLNRSSNNLSKLQQKIIIGNIGTVRPDADLTHSTFRPSLWFSAGWKTDLEIWSNIESELTDLDWNYYNKQLISPEKLWLSCYLKRYNILNLDWRNSQAHDDLAWLVLNDNFNIVNTTSEAAVINLQDSLRSERSINYYTSKLYQLKQAEICKVRSKRDTIQV